MWDDPARTDEAEALCLSEELLAKRSLHFPHVLRDTRKIGEDHPGIDPTTPESMDKPGVALAHCASACDNFYDHEEVERVFYLEMEQQLLDFFPGATDALVYNHDIFDMDYQGDRNEDQDAKNPASTAPTSTSSITT